jgi:hypothetical protein
MPKKERISRNQTSEFSVKTSLKPNPGKGIKPEQKILPEGESGKKGGLLRMLPTPGIPHHTPPNNPAQVVIEQANHSEE